MIDFPITIYHNPKCGTSRNTLAILRAAGYEPTVVEYLQTGWTHAQLMRLLSALNARPRDIMRIKGTPAEDLGLTNANIDEAAIIDAMVTYPILVNRPIVVTPKGAKLCRPSEMVLSLIDHQLTSFTKEDGEVVDLRAQS